MRRDIDPSSPSGPEGVRGRHLGTIINPVMTSEDKVHGESDVKRDDGLKFPNLLGSQLDTERSHIRQQMVDLPLSNQRKDIRRFMQKIRQALTRVNN